MEELRGGATGVRHTVNVTSPGNEQPASTTHIALFRIGGEQVEMQSSTALAINEGDQLLVVGSRRNGVFKTLAYRNFTTGVSYSENWMLSVAVSLFICLVGGNFVATALRGPQPSPSIAVVGAAVVCAGLLFVRRSLRIRAAARIVSA